MIASRVSVGAVCLRCRLRLLRQPTPIRRVASDATTALPINEPTDSDVSQRTSQDANQGQSSRSRERSPIYWKRLSLRKRHVAGNRLLDEEEARLDSDMLGKPGYAILMKDGGTFERNKLPSFENGASSQSSNNPVTGIEALLDEQREPVTIEEARSNIHDLEPKTDKILSEKDFRKLQKLLTGGFLNAQLQDYIGWYKSGAGHQLQEPTTDSSAHPEFPWIQKKTPWTPLNSQSKAVEGTNRALQDYIPDTTSPKERLAMHLMHKCWGLSIAAQLGETQIQLNDPEFILLMRGSQRFLNTLGKIWLEPDEKMEAFQDQKILRLVTTRLKADSLLRELDETLRNVTRRTFPVVLFGSEAPNDTVLEELGRITNSYISKSQTLRRLHVTWIEIKSRAARGLSSLEDTSHIALRLLLTASGSPNTGSTLLSSTVPLAPTARLIEDTTSKGKLGWKDRLARWARYMYPLTSEKSVTGVALPIGKFELPFEPLEKPETLKDDLEFYPDTPFPSHPVKWSQTGRTSTTAHFGHILHSYPPSIPTPRLPDLLAGTDKRVFAPLPPHPLHLTKFETVEASHTPPLVTTKSTLVLRFWPSPSSNPVSNPNRPRGKKAPINAGDTPPAPILELRLAASDSGVQGVESLRAIYRTHHTDVMLPSSPVDVRFTQMRYETLLARNSETLAGWQPLVDFLQPARLDLENGKLETPARQRFPIPRRLITTHPFTFLGEQSEEPDDTASPPREPDGLRDTLVSISYDFVGLELHRSATLPYEGHQLTYTSIEAGQGGGRRAEVTLEPLQSATATPSADKDRLQEDFLACCSRFVTERSLWS
ncbi:hypothetical protein EKO27_g5933 [Xylaria grammica]|uniref:Uncharacterized protein n=1 Tax=Xylaria grammica TaxID=363999 RepID=A0A439D449_9PEZI|nr:hypothetical protein EKO27_g5933 [Xylaria grammica]